ncbi:hypothetical protein CCICO_01525 [Corynebacterium ciconiae DSM 44920]|uniref:hypothetical protein n=1 Tax=Corynebacterium ciconiae TaxID=227319 RepID=UPI00037BF603|nr:hypothetical protein [Corynebacterium ciconiae]WKD60359.1 hypothetical protein CCICO_01525 [Corynebacterium ciconiae DSM 44920]
MSATRTAHTPLIGLALGAMSIAAGLCFMATMIVRGHYSDTTALVCVICGAVMVVHAALVPSFPPLARFALFAAAGITIVVTEGIFTVWVAVLVAALACGGSLLGTWFELWGPGKSSARSHRPHGSLLRSSATPAPPMVYTLMMAYTVLATLGVFAFSLPTAILILLLGTVFVAAVCYYPWAPKQRIALSIAALGTVSTWIGALLILVRQVLSAIYIWPILALPAALIAMTLVYRSRPTPSPSQRVKR